MNLYLLFISWWKESCVCRYKGVDVFDNFVVIGCVVFNV